jgi:hypothetical protein
MRRNLFLALSFMMLMAQAQPTGNILLGRWKVIKTTSADISIPLSKEEGKQGLGVIVTFKTDKIEVLKNEYIDGCDGPKYKIKTVNALRYYDNDKTILKRLSISTKFVKIVSTDCGLPCDEILVINDNLISIGIDGYWYFLSRVTNTGSASNLASPK